MAQRKIEIAMNLTDQGWQATVNRVNESNNKMMRDATEGARRVAQSYQNVENSVNGYGSGLIKARAALQPFNLAVGQATALLGQHNPAVGAAAQVVDSFVVSVVAGAAATGGWRSALAAITAILNPWVAGIVAGGAALAFFVSRSRDAKEAQEKFDEAMRTGNIAFFEKATRDAATALGEVEQKYEKIIALQRSLNAPAGSPLARAQEAGRGSLEKELADADRAVREAQAKEAEVRRTAALKTLPDLEKTLALQDKLARANERDRPLIEARAKAEELLAKGLNETDIAQAKALLTSTALAKVREIDKRAAEERAQKLKQLADVEAAGLEKMLRSEQALQLQIVALRDGEDALAKAKIAVDAQAVAQQFGAETAARYTERLGLLTDQIAVLKRQQEEATVTQQLYDAAHAASAQQRQEELDYLEKKAALEQRAGEFEVQRLRALGAPDADIVQRQIELLRAQQQAALSGGTPLQAGQLEAIQRQIELSEIQLLKLKTTSIDVAGEVARVVTDITSAVVNGTLKWADIGRSVLASFVRVGLEQFTGFLRQMQNQMRSAQLAGAIGAPLSGSAGGPGGLIGPAMQNGQFFSGGGGGGLLGNIFGTSLGIGGATIGSAATAGFGGLALSSLFGGSGLQHGLSSLGSIGGHLLGASTFGAGITSSITGALSGVLGGALAGALAGMVIPGIGAIIGFLVGSLFNDVPEPSVWVKSVIKFYYDALTTTFGAFNQATILRFKDIKGSAAQQVLQEHQSIMDGVSRQFVDLLNTFPVAVHEQMSEALEFANAFLERALGSKKYSEGGSRNIQEELEALRTSEAPRAFFLGLRETIGIGLRETLNLAGFDFSGIIGERFGRAPDSLNPRWWNDNRFVPGLMTPTDPEQVSGFIEAMQKFISFTGTLGGISPRGVQPFLTGADNERLQAEIQRVLEASSEGFAPAVDDLLERIKPLSDFLARSVQQASDLFGRGMIAALEAATASQANRAFLATLGEGTRQIIFQGITEAFIASAQFTDLLAPIQQTIRDFTQQAISTGETPDIDAFRRAILPDIEDISTRAEALAPLIAELHRLGLNVTDALRALSGRGPSNITINLPPGWQGGEAGVRDLASQLDDLLRGQLNP